MYTRLIFCLICLLTKLSSLSLKKYEFQKLNVEIENQVNLGKFNNALILSNKLLTKNLDENQRYVVLTTKSKIHFWTDNLFEYNQSSKEAFEIKKKKSGIYKAYYYTQKAAFFHYHILADSAVYYSDKSMELLRKNWCLRKSVPFHFIYQIYGTTFLYRFDSNRDYSNSVEDQEKALFPIITYQDSALLYINQVMHFNQEKAIIHRSKGNRIMDVVGYSIRYNKSDFINYNFQIKKSNEALKEYYLALYSLDKNDHSLSYGIKSLIALAFYCTNRQKSGDAILWPIICQLKNRPIKLINSENIQLLNVLQTFSHNIISQNNFDSRILNVIHIYKLLRDDWYWYLISNNKNYLDSYGQSPTSMLSLIYIWLNKIRKRKSNLINQLNYGALDNYIYYSKTISEVFKKSSNSEIHVNQGKTSVLEHLNIYSIQNKLLKNEALMVQIFTSMRKGSYLLITKDHIEVDYFKRLPLNHFSSLKIYDLIDFKKTAYQNFLTSPFSRIFKSSKIKKLYVAIDITENFDLMITDTIGNSFDKLNYFKKKINVVKVYNPIDFFSSKSKSKTEISNKIKPYLMGVDVKNKLPFTSDALIYLGQKKINYLKNVNLFERGVAHILGHGNLKLERDKQSYTNILQSKELKKLILTNQIIKTDLLVLNFCFGAHKRNMFYPDRDLQNQLIFKGANGVIASPFETIDQSSSFIFKKFYAYLNYGKSIEDALHLAKLSYLRSHSGTLSHPLFWSTYELTSNVKDMRLKSTEKNQLLFVPMLILINGLIGEVILIFIRYLQERRVNGPFQQT